MYQCTQTHTHTRQSRLDKRNAQNYIQNRVDILSCKIIQIVERRGGIFKIQLNRDFDDWAEHRIPTAFKFARATIYGRRVCNYCVRSSFIQH